MSADRRHPPIRLPDTPEAAEILAIMESESEHGLSEFEAARVQNYLEANPGILDILEAPGFPQACWAEVDSALPSLAEWRQIDAGLFREIDNSTAPTTTVVTPKPTPAERLALWRVFAPLAATILLTILCLSRMVEDMGAVEEPFELIERPEGSRVIIDAPDLDDPTGATIIYVSNG